LATTGETKPNISHSESESHFLKLEGEQRMEKTNPNSLDGIINTLDYYDLWYKWFINSNVKEQVKFNEMNKQEQYKYLKEQVNENK